MLRLRAGEPVGVTDGRGGYVPCRYLGGSDRAGARGVSGVVEPVGPAVFSSPRTPLLTVGFAPVKGDRPEWAVQKLTELGVDRIVLVAAERAVVRWAGERAASHLDRLAKIARAAVMQSRQVWVPEIVGPVPATALLSGLEPEPGRAAGTAVCQMGGPPPSVGLHTLLVGPEGGWSPDELSAAGSQVVGLGPAVLRAETAAVTAGVLMTALRAGVVGPVPGPVPGPGPGPVPGPVPGPEARVME